MFRPTPIRWLAVLAAAAGLAHGQVDPQFVIVGNPGNADDVWGYGGVAYEFRIGRFEVTNTEYTAFLNAVADSDPYGLFNPSMQSDPQGGITRSGSDGTYSYAVKPGFARLPVVFVSWFDAARFANWLENGQPTGPQGPGTTEDGAYLLSGAMAGTGFSASPTATFRLPGEDEWYKAAYHVDPALEPDATFDGYYAFPTRSDSKPRSRNGHPTDPGSANYYFNDGVNTNPYSGGFAVTNAATFSPTQTYLTAVGAFPAACSYHGTLDQAGNAAEWTDGIRTGERVLRGGSWLSQSLNLEAKTRSSSAPEDELSTIGFRLAASLTAVAPVSAAAWRATVFAGELADPRTALDADYDGDNRKNLLEFALGTDPKAVDPSPAVGWGSDHTWLGYDAFLGDIGQRFLTLVLPMRPEAAGLTVTLHKSTTLAPGSWSPADTPVVRANSREREFRDLAPADGQARAFYRFEVTE